MEADIVFIGSGAGGLTTAVVCAKLGIEVIVLEKTGSLGGTTALSGGGLWIPGNTHMQESGLADSRAEAEAYLRATLGNFYDEAKIEAYLETGPRMVDYMEAETEVRLAACPLPDYEPDAPGFKVGRTLLTESFDGSCLGDDLKHLRKPLPLFMLFGDMQIEMSDAAQFQVAHKSLRALRHSLRLLANYVSDRVRFGRGARLTNGNALAGRLVRSAQLAGVRMPTNAPAIRLLEENDAVTGVVASIAGQETTITARRGVVLASGGFGANPAMRAEHITLAEHGWSLQPEGNEGDGISMGMAVGGTLNRGNAANAIWVPVSGMTENGKTSIFPHLPADRHAPGSIIVDETGKRFVNEAFHYQHFGETMRRLGITRAFLIADSDFRRKYGLGLARPAPNQIGKYLRNGYLIKGDSIRELAQKLGLAGNVLADTIARFNDNAIADIDPEFGRGQDIYSRSMGDPAHLPNPSLGPIVNPPYYAVEIRPGDLCTLAGLDTDATGRVLREDGSPIAGLYAVGIDMNTMMRGK